MYFFDEIYMEKNFEIERSVNKKKKFFFESDSFKFKNDIYPNLNVSLDYFEF